tara:strand:- start:151 stop:423 length:273 start_codon:yes stop_codon:yes gene_type:complete
MRGIKLRLSNGYILSVVPEMNEKVHDGLVEVALLNSDGDFVNTWLWLGVPDDQEDNDYWPDVERFVSAIYLPKIIQKAYSYAERIADAKI